MAIRILCFGDSNTWGAHPQDGSRYPEDLRWTGLLQKQLGPNFRIIEEGQNGRTCEMDDPVEGEKSGITYIVPCIESQLPLDLIVVMLGTNDMKLRFKRSASEIADGARRLIQKIHAFLEVKDVRVPILLISPIELHENIVHSEFGEMFDAERGLAKSQGLAHYFEGVAKDQNCHYLDAAKITAASPIDALHLDAAGHSKMADAIQGKILEIFTT